MLLDRERFVHHHVAVQDGVLARDHGNLGEVARRGAVELHVAARALGIELGRREHADRRLELGGQGELRELLQAGADPGARVAGAADRDQHVLAHAGGDGHGRGLDGGHAGGATHRHEHRELEVGQAEIGDKILGDAAAREIRHDAVDVARAKAGIGDGGQARLELQGQPALGRAARVGGLADAAHRRLLAKRMRHVDLPPAAHRALPPGKREGLSSRSQPRGKNVQRRTGFAQRRRTAPPHRHQGNFAGRIAGMPASSASKR